MTNRITHARITALPRPMPEGLLDPLPQVWVRVDGGDEELLFGYYPEELSFTAEEFIGLTLAQGRELKRQKDVAYLQK